MKICTFNFLVSSRKFELTTKSHIYLFSTLGFCFLFHLRIHSWSLSPWAALAWPGGPQLDHCMGAPNFILSHTLVDAFIFRPHTDHPQGPTGQSEALAGGEGHSIPQPQHGGWGVPAHLTGELGTLAPRDEQLGQLHSDFGGFCRETRAGIREAKSSCPGPDRLGRGLQLGKVPSLFHQSHARKGHKENCQALTP